MIEEGLQKWILGNDALQAAMPSDDALFLVTIPEKPNYPCVAFAVVSGKPDVTFDGPSGFSAKRIQFTFAGSDVANGTSTPGSGYVAAKRLAEVMRQQLTEGNDVPNGASVGALLLPGTLPDGTKVFNVVQDMELDNFDADTQRYHIVHDYFFYFSQNP